MPFFVVSVELDAPEGLELAAALELDGWSDDAEPPVVPPVVPPAEPPPDADDELLDGVLGEVLEPAPAEPLLIVAEPDIELPPEPEGEEGAALDDEDDDGAVAGALGAAVEPEADEELVPDGAVVVPRDAVLLSVRSHAAIRLAPKATDTATASVESFMWPP